MTHYPLEVTQEQMVAILASEAVALQEYEAHGERFSRLVAWGTLAEMQLEAERPKLLVLPNYVTLIATQAIRVADLVPPDGQEAPGTEPGEKESPAGARGPEPGTDLTIGE